jgi:outer membrane receptor protein involved in Fe transport
MIQGKGPKIQIAVISGLLATTNLAGAARAQISDLSASGSASSGDIMVTATKRSEPLQAVPLSITALSGAAIERQGIVDIQDWGNRIPNLTFQAGDSTRTDLQTSVQIRGVSGAGTTGFYIDDSPLVANINPRVIELDRIEVLRGPQGTLYGARSMGGTVRYITRQPDLENFSGEIHAAASGTQGAGSPNEAVDGVVNIPVVREVFAIRALAYVDHEAGWLDRAPLPNSPVQYPVHEDFNDANYVGGQIIGLLSLDGGDITITPRFMYEKDTRGGRSEADYYAGNTTNARLFDIPEDVGSNWKLSTLTVKYRIPIGEIAAASSYFAQRDHDQEDGSEFLNANYNAHGTPVPGYLYAYGKDKIFSQELRYTSSLRGPLKLTAGAFYQSSKTPTYFPQQSFEPITNNLFSLNRTQTVDELAFFGEATLNVTHKLNFTAGVRHFNNKIVYSSLSTGLLGDGRLYAGTQKQAGFTPKFGVEYRLDPNIMFFSNAAKGYRVGGVNSSRQICAPLASRPLGSPRTRHEAIIRTRSGVTKQALRPVGLIIA